MQGYHQQHASPQPPMGRSTQLHEGVRTFMNGVYGWMAAGLAVTAAVSWGIAQSPQALYTLYGTGLKWLLLLPMFLPIFIGARIPSMSRGGATFAFMLVSALVGVSLSYIPVVYQTQTLFTALGATVAAFAGMSLVGFVIKKDLTGMGQVLIMAIWGAIFASFANIFFVQSGGMSIMISVVVAVAAAGLTAYHTQAIKQLYMVNGGRGNLAINGALVLYINFLNLFLSLLHLLGGSRE